MSSELILLLIAALLLCYASVVIVLLLIGRSSEARALAGFIPDCIVLFRRLLGDERVGRKPRRGAACASSQLLT